MKLAKHLQWSERAEAGLAETLGDSRASIIADVNAGRLELWECNGGDAWIVTCCDTSGETPELAVCCVQGRGLVELSHVFVDLARNTGCKRVRWFTQRPALQRLLKRQAGLDVVLAGYVYHVELEALH